MEVWWGESPALDFIMNSTRISDDIKAFMLEHNKVMLSPNGTYVQQSENNIIEIVLKQNEDRQLTVEELTLLYNEYVESNGLDKSLEKEVRDLEKVSRNDYHNAIKSTKGRFRYFDFSDIDDSTIDQLNSVLDVPSGVYGIKYFLIIIQK